LFVAEDKQKQMIPADCSKAFNWRSARRSARDDIIEAFFISLLHTFRNPNLVVSAAQNT
jgi:hypothetical protein